MFYRQDFQGGGKRNQASKALFSNTGPVLISDPVLGDRAKPSFDTKCLTGAVNVLVEQLKVLDWGRRGAGVGVQGPAD